MKIDLKISGFSLAEALITLLIVCIISLASTPVITKKVRNKKNSQKTHGEYFCYIDDNNIYHSVLKTGTVEKHDALSTQYCEFSPPSNASDFLIMTIGGGGGGGAGYKQTNKKLFLSSGTYTIPSDGMYEILVIGGGGGGYGDDEYGQYTGGSGGWDKKTVNFKKNDELFITIGVGGKKSANCEKDPVSGKKKCVGGSHGSNTSIKSSIVSLTASGGRSNLSQQAICYRILKEEDSCGGTPGGVNGGYLKEVVEPKISEDFLSKDLKPFPGSGTSSVGLYNNSDIAKILDGNGADGAAVLKYAESCCGEGGRAGRLATMGLAQMKSSVKMTVGLGGKGSAGKDNSAENGKHTSFGNLLIAEGGLAGGSVKNCEIDEKNNIVYGKNGEASAYIKESSAFGACGGGKSCKTVNSNGETITFLPGVNGMNAAAYGSGGGGGTSNGQGGNGKSGFVYIKW